MPVLGSMVWPPCSTTSISACIAARRSVASCSAFGSSSACSCRRRASRTMLHRGESSSEGNCACQGSWTCSNSMTIVAALYDPLAILLTDNLADVVTPHHDSPDWWTACAYAIVSPSSGKVVPRARIAAHLTAHVPPTPCSGTPSVGVVATVMRRGSCFCARRESEKQCHRRNDFTHTAVLLFAWDWLLPVVVPVGDAVARAWHGRPCGRFAIAKAEEGTVRDHHHGSYRQCTAMTKFVRFHS